jgi:hypothetical protein
MTTARRLSRARLRGLVAVRAAVEWDTSRPPGLLIHPGRPLEAAAAEEEEEAADKADRREFAIRPRRSAWAAEAASSRKPRAQPSPQR